MNISEICMDKNETILQAMKLLDQKGTQILFITEENKLIGCLSNGDVRKAILDNYPLDTCMDVVCNKKPFFLYEEEKSLARKHVEEKAIQAIPIVNKNMELVEIVFANKAKDLKTYSPIELPVVMMAGGLGTRLYPYTRILPKPLIPVADVPISERIINSFCKYGCKDYYMIVNYKKSMIKAYFNELEKDYQLHFIDEEQPLGTGGGLSLLKGLINETFILTNCDILIRDDMSKAYEYHKETGNVATMICSLKNFQIAYGVVEFGKDGQIQSMKEKPNMSYFTNTGCYIIEPEVLNAIPDNTNIGMPEILEQLISQGKKVGAYPINENAWLDMGEMDTFEMMTNKLEEEFDI